MGDLESLNLSNNKNLHIFPPAACAATSSMCWNEKVETVGLEKS
jgi:hypothetical protein